MQFLKYRWIITDYDHEIQMHVVAHFIGRGQIIDRRKVFASLESRLEFIEHELVVLVALRMNREHDFTMQGLAYTDDITCSATDDFSM